MKRLLLLAITVCAALSAAGCSSTEESLCDDKCDCEGCSDWQYDDCVHSYDNVYRDADYEGCLDLYDQWIECQDDTWWCSGHDFETSCGHERDRLNDCTKH